MHYNRYLLAINKLNTNHAHLKGYIGLYNLWSLKLQVH